MGDRNSKVLDERTYVRRVLITGGLLALALTAWTLADVILLAFGAVLLGLLLRAIAEPLGRWTHMPRRVALTAVVVGLFALAWFAARSFGPDLAAQMRVLVETVPTAWHELLRRLNTVGLGEQIVGWLDQQASTGGQAIASIGQLALSLLNAVTALVLVVAGGIYLAYQPGLYRTGLLELIPRERRALAAETLEASGRALRLWLIGQLAAMTAVGVLTAVGLTLIGVPSALALGLIAGLADFVPVVGPVVAAGPAILLALAQGPDTALWTLALYVGVQQLEGNVITPIVQQRAVELPPALLLFALVAAGALFGPLGVILAAPLTVVVFVAVKRLYVREALRTPTTIPGAEPKPD